MNKNNVIGIVIISLLAGGILGYTISSTRQSVHMMPDGSMMHGESKHDDGHDHSTMTMEDMMIAMSANLAGKTGDDFDKAFLDEMIPHHQGAVEMAKAVLVNAKHQELKDFAQSIIDVQNREINQMEVWRKEWYQQ